MNLKQPKTDLLSNKCIKCKSIKCMCTYLIYKL